ncbi:hypothetical protein PV327_003637 [Microctonus hyperodae]|uniref:Uncharacterized protein n=1 Tax=Microctonus hyperodae TaxID=165561 RepID=A0AA39L193_MICHY|nr:hypothetical protein PV327_003637 [Microctonus hyperodae]
MTSRRAGGEGSTNRAPPQSPSSSSSEDNGFVNRPRVVGLYVKNLSREELDSLAEEGIYGATGDPGPSQRHSDINPDLICQLPLTSSSSSSSSLSLLTSPTSSGAFSLVQTPKRRIIQLENVDNKSVTSEIRRRRTVETGDARKEDNKLHDQMDERREESRNSPELDDICHGRRSPQNSGDEESSTKHSEDESSRLSPSGYEVFDQEDSSERTIRQYAEDSEPEIILEVDVNTNVDMENKTSRQSSSNHLSEMFPRCAPKLKHTRDNQIDDDDDDDDDDNDDDDDDNEREDEGDNDNDEDEDDDDERKIEEFEVGKSRFRSQDSTRLRPPLVGTAGTSADSGTCDSASAEIQPDTLLTPQQTTLSDGGCGDMVEKSDASVNDCTPGSKTSGDGDPPCGGSVCGSGVGWTKSNKHTVKPFTRESLDRLENRTVQLVREYGFQPRRKTSVEDGAVLPHKFEPFPSNLYGRPLEEIDNFIYDEKC